MANAAKLRQVEVGIVGLNPCGRTLARILTEHGVGVAAFDRDPQNIKALARNRCAKSVHLAATVKEMMAQLGHFRTVFLTCSDPDVDSFGEVVEQLEAEDLLIDAGYCHFKECEQRARRLRERNIRHLAVGVIGVGEEDEADPVLMAGGRQEIFLSARPFLESLAEIGHGQLYLGYLGHVAAGHFVKTIHDGIDHALRQLARETLALLKETLELDSSALRDAAAAWPMTVNNSSERVNAARWTTQAAEELNSPAPAIAASAGLRALSEFDRQNELARTPFRQPRGHYGDDAESVIAELHGGLNAAVMITYAQGMAVLTAGSQRYGLNLNMAEVLRLWKGCCGKRAGLLDEMGLVLESMPCLPNLLLEDDWSEKVMGCQEFLRHAVWRAGPLRVAVPVMTAALDYLDSFRGAWLPVNLIQAQPRRPRSGSHALGALPAIDQEQHGHPHRQTIRHLVDDDRAA